MESMILHKTLTRRTCELAAWQRAAVGLLAVSAIANGAYAAALMDARDRLASAEAAHQIELE